MWHRVQRTQPFQLTGPIDSEYDASRCLSAYVNLSTSPNRDVLPEDVFVADKAFYLFIDEVELLQDFKPAEVLSNQPGNPGLDQRLSAGVLLSVRCFR